MQHADPLPPPTDVSIIIILSDSDAPTGPLKLKFQWNSIAPDCTAIGYITSLECGSCPNTTTNTEVVCTDIVIGDQCMFTVQTQVCDSIISNITTVPLTLKGTIIMHLYDSIIVHVYIRSTNQSNSSRCSYCKCHPNIQS